MYVHARTQARARPVHVITRVGIQKIKNYQVTPWYVIQSQNIKFP